MDIDHDRHRLQKSPGVVSWSAYPRSPVVVNSLLLLEPLGDFRRPYLAHVGLHLPTSFSSLGGAYILKHAIP